MMKKAQTKKPAVKNRLIEEPSQNTLNHVFEVYEESGSDIDYIEDSLKGENKRKSKEENYTNMDEKKEGKRADLLKLEKPQYHEKMRKLGSPRKWHCQTLGKTFL